MPVDAALLLGISPQERPVADDVDEPWHALREAEGLALGGGAEDLTQGAGDLQAVFDVACRLLARQGLQVVAP